MYLFFRVLICKLYVAKKNQGTAINHVYYVFIRIFRLGI